MVSHCSGEDSAGLPVMISFVEELFSFSQCRTLLVSSLTATHSTTKPLTDRFGGGLQRTTKLPSPSGVAVSSAGGGGSGGTEKTKPMPTMMAKQ